MNKTRGVMWLVLALLVGMFLVSPVGAQETTGQDSAAESTGQQTDQSADILSLTLGELIGILFGAGALMVGIGKILWDANQTPGGPSVDTRLTQRVDTAGADREWIERLEKAYALGGIQSKTLIDAFAGVMTNVAPLTGAKVDDAILRLLKDIQQPGTMVIQANDAESGKAAAQGFDARIREMRAMRGDDVAGSESAG